MIIREGYMPFGSYYTYYRITGDLNSGKTPLVLLHGGPGSTHNYFEVLDRLSDDGRPLVMYDQLGCGYSYVDQCPDLWNQETWIDELEQMRQWLHLEEVHLLGQSWGGMLALAYLLERKPAGVRSVILSSTLSSSRLWSHEQHRRIRFLSPEDQEAIREAETTGDYTNPAYQRANEHFMERYCAGAPDEHTPECIRRKKRSGTEAYNAAWGPNEYTPTGTLKDFEVTDRLHEIHIPALIINGTNDLCSPLVAKTMADRLSQAKWELMDGPRHMCFVEQTDQYCAILENWFKEVEK